MNVSDKEPKSYNSKNLGCNSKNLHAEAAVSRGHISLRTDHHYVEARLCKSNRKFRVGHPPARWYGDLLKTAGISWMLQSKDKAIWRLLGQASVCMGLI